MWECDEVWFGWWLHFAQQTLKGSRRWQEGFSQLTFTLCHFQSCVLNVNVQGLVYTCTHCSIIQSDFKAPVQDQDRVDFSHWEGKMKWKTLKLLLSRKFLESLPIFVETNKLGKWNTNAVNRGGNFGQAAFSVKATQPWNTVLSSQLKELRTHLSWHLQRQSL